jgi:hypothetical protein
MTKSYTYNEYTVREYTPRSLEKPSEGKVLSEHPTLKSAKAALTANSYIYNEEYHFTVLPQHYGLEPEATALATAERLEGEEDEDTEVIE